MGAMENSIRADLWLWHARFAKTRALSASLAASGKVRLTHAGKTTRLDKASRMVHVGDELMFVSDGRMTHVRIVAMAASRGSYEQAKTLYETLGLSSESTN